jgi:hypothetical protein
MHRRSVVAALLVLLAVGAIVALSQFTTVFAVSAPSTVPHMPPVSVTTYGDAQITAACDHANPGASLGLRRPTLVSRIDGNDAVIFATRSKYSACILFNTRNVSVIKPAPIVPNAKPIDETFSLSSSNKVPHRSLWTTNTWFVVRVGPTVATLTAATGGSSEDSPVVDGFAFVHLTETADVQGKFAWGLAAGFSAGGELVGSEVLR